MPGYLERELKRHDDYRFRSYPLQIVAMKCLRTDMVRSKLVKLLWSFLHRSSRGRNSTRHEPERAVCLWWLARLGDVELTRIVSLLVYVECAQR